MKTKFVTLLAALSIVSVGLPQSQQTAAHAGEAGCVQAGYGEADATWHVGVSAGQYAGERAEAPPVPEDENYPGELGGWAEAKSQESMDPHAHHVRRQKSYGVQSRIEVRSIVVEGCPNASGERERVALVKNDNYLAQDLLQRRIAQIIEAEDAKREIERRLDPDAPAPTGIDYEHIVVSATHNHSSPYVFTPMWGLALFQDAFDIRAFEYEARKHAEAIIKAADDLQPAEMSATTVHHDIYKSNIPGPEDADDGSPAGYPRDFGDEKVVVMRFDNPVTDAPIATWVNFGQHPESNDTYDLLTADFLGPLQRFVDRATGSPMVFSQSDVGSAEGPYRGWNVPTPWLADGTRRAWAHVGHAQTERGARFLADSIVQGFQAIENQTALPGETLVPYSSDFVVDAYENAWVPGPKSHPYPSVWNCKTRKHATGNVEGPGVPTCGDVTGEFYEPWEDGTGQPFPTSQGNPTLEALYDEAKKAGIPIPDHIDGPGFGAVEENNRIRLQVVRLGDVVLGSCSCEAQVDLILNFESRANDVVGDFWDGYRYYDGSDPDHPEYRCDKTGADEWSCIWPENGVTPSTTKITDLEYRRMVAQVENDATGWDDLIDPSNTNENGAPRTSFSEPVEPERIYGNFTHEELGGPDCTVASIGEPVTCSDHTPREDVEVLTHLEGEETPTDEVVDQGYKLAVGLGHTGDYTGYTVSYREYMNRDHYRKALTSYGPHTADWMVTNMVYMAAALNDNPDRNDLDPERKAWIATANADEARQEAIARVLGRLSSSTYDAWYAALPPDKNAATTQPSWQPEDAIRRFDAATFTWRGGSNAVDNPTVVVERCVSAPPCDESSEWQTYADQSGEVQTFLKFPVAGMGVANTYTGQQEWEWTANFEAFDFGPCPDYQPCGPRQVPDGVYRFDVRGKYRMDPAEWASRPTSPGTTPSAEDALERDASYDLQSEPFEVKKWDGIRVVDLEANGDGDITFDVEGADNSVLTQIAPGLAAPDIRYPRTYDAHDIISYIEETGQPDVCERCSFRGWAPGSNVAQATITVVREGGETQSVPAERSGDGFIAHADLYEGDRAFIAPEGVVDTYGEVNGEGSAEIVGTRTRPTPTPTPSETATGSPTGSPSGSPTEDPGPASTTLVFTPRSAEAGEYSDEALIEVRLTSEGTPLAGEEVAFELIGADGSSAWTATTNANGVAGKSVLLTRRPGSYQLTARYAGNEERLASATTAGFVIERDRPLLHLTAVRKSKKGDSFVQKLNATLTTDDRDPLTKKKLEFFADDVVFERDTTNKQGTATVKVPQRYREASAFEVRFAGDEFLRPASARVSG